MRLTMLLLISLLITAHAGAQGVEVKLTPLTKQQQAKLLERRNQPGMVGSFGNFGSMLYAINNVVVHTDSERINATRLHSPFPKWYKPTWAEFFDSIARQTSSSWSYDEERGFWVFAEPAAALPYKVQLPEGWQAEDHGICVTYGVEDRPVASVYVLGHYSAAEGEESLFTRVRDEMAVRSASRIAPDLEVEAMDRVAVADCEALYFETDQTPDGSTWRQWVFVGGGHALSILSALPEDDEARLLADLHALVASVRVAEGNEDQEGAVGAGEVESR